MDPRVLFPCYLLSSAFPVKAPRVMCTGRIRTCRGHILYTHLYAYEYTCIFVPISISSPKKTEQSFQDVVDDFDIPTKSSGHNNGLNAFRLNI